MDQTPVVSPPSLQRIRQVAQELATDVLRTPTVQWPVEGGNGGLDMQLFVKLELLQRTGSFKLRGALNALRHAMQVSEYGAFRGVTAFSAGNHAIATACAAQILGTTAKVVMPRTANAFRQSRCTAYGAQIVYGDTIADLLQIVEQIQAQEGRSLVHPFEGMHTIEGTATVGLELCEDLSDLDTVIVPVGGGGLIAGVACAIKQMQPHCQLIGVEPEGANGMQQSLSEQAAKEHVMVDTIADSLGAPMHAPISFSVVQQCVDEVVTVSDEQMREGMRAFFANMKLAVEPACAASLAAVSGPLAKRLKGQRVAMIACGSNIDADTYCSLLRR